MSTIGNRTDIRLSKCTSVQISNITKVCSKCPPCARMQAGRRGRHCLIASLMNTWWNVPTLRSGVTSAGQRHESGCDTHAPAASPKSGLWGKICDEFFARYPFSCLSTSIKTLSSAEDTISIVYANCLQVTSDCSKQRCIGN